MRKLNISLILLLFVATSISVVGQGDNEGLEEGGGERIVVFWIEALIFLFIAIALILNGMVIRKFKASVYGTPFIYTLAGMLLLGLSRVLILLYDLEILEIEDVPLQVYWHLLFYLAMASFLIALSKIISTAKGKRLVGFTKSDSIILGIFALLALAVILGSKTADPWLVSWFEGGIMDHSGIVHFIAFAFAGFLATKLLWVYMNKKYSGAMVATIIMPFFIFLALMSLNHFWELLTESWKVILVPETTIETVEQFFWLPAFIAMAYGFVKLRKEMREAFATNAEKK